MSQIYIPKVIRLQSLFNSRIFCWFRIFKHNDVLLLLPCNTITGNYLVRGINVVVTYSVVFVKVLAEVLVFELLAFN